MESGWSSRRTWWLASSIRQHSGWMMGRATWKLAGWLSTWWLADWLGQQHGISDRRGICSLLTLLYENDGSSRLGHLEPKGRIPRWRPLGGQQEDYIYTGSGGEGRSRHHPEGRHARKHLNSEFGYTHASSRLIWPCYPSSRQQLSLHVRTSIFIPEQYALLQNVPDVNRWCLVSLS